jgi:2-oxo-3-hexenedioate decarboxylase
MRAEVIPDERLSLVDCVAGEVLAVLGSGGQIAPFSGRPGGLSLGEAYGVTAKLERARKARGERAVGRKIGFTNRAIWPEYGVYAPIWGYVTERSVFALEAVTELPLARFAEPRIEPEIMLGLARTPSPHMDEATLAGCIEWVAHGFEVVQSPFPRWKFAAADTVAVNGLHGALLAGRHHAFAPRAESFMRELPAFSIELYRNGELVDRGCGANVLDGPLSALRHLVGLLAEDPVNPPLAAGEIVSTGTLTRAFPVKPGETWQTRLSGIPLEGATLRFV